MLMCMESRGRGRVTILRVGFGDTGKQLYLESGSQSEEKGVRRKE